MQIHLPPRASATARPHDAHRPPVEARAACRAALYPAEEYEALHGFDSFRARSCSGVLRVLLAGAPAAPAAAHLGHEAPLCGLPHLGQTLLCICANPFCVNRRPFFRPLTLHPV